VDNQVRLPKLQCDSSLIATAAGSTAYARSMGNAPFHVDTPTLILTASSVSSPPAWRSANLKLESQIRLRNLDPKKRPLEAFVDSVSQGRAAEMRVRVSRIASAQLAFLSGYNFAEKLTAIQFPK
jgi:NAD kinase